VIDFRYRIKNRPEVFRDSAEDFQALSKKCGRKPSEIVLIGASNVGATFEKRNANLTKPD